MVVIRLPQSLITTHSFESGVLRQGNILERLTVSRIFLRAQIMLLSDKNIRSIMNMLYSYAFMITFITERTVPLALVPNRPGTFHTSCSIISPATHRYSPQTGPVPAVLAPPGCVGVSVVALAAGVTWFVGVEVGTGSGACGARGTVRGRALLLVP